MEPEITTAQTIHLIDRETEDGAFVDVGPRGESVGDQFLFRNNEFDPRSGRRVGEVFATGTIHLRAVVFEASLVLFGRGKITLAGSIYNNPTFTLAVTGGTGEFQNVRGQAVIRDPAGDEPTRVTLHLIP